MRRHTWNIKAVNPDAERLSRQYRISATLAHILLSRGISETDFHSFLFHDLAALHPPQLLPDMEKAVQRIQAAAKTKENIFIIGDYDVDGITSLAIFHEYIKQFPGIFSFYIPHRVKEGYGVSIEAIRQAKEKNATLIVAFDCGTNAYEEISFARAQGIDMIIVDHHHPKETSPAPSCAQGAFAFINPKRKDSQYPFRDLSSAALSYKLLEALQGKSCYDALDLVALSLVCDVVPLKGENRILLKEGLKRLRTSERPAIKALCEISKIKQQQLDTFHLGYILGPRLNASGRVASAQESLELFLSDDNDRIVPIVKKLQEYNQLRRDIEAQILKEAQAQVEMNSGDDYAIVVAGEGWHSGVLGIVASRLTDKYYRPSFVISFDEQRGRGSGRSIHSVHLMEVLEKCSDSLCTYGGHKKAAGIEIFKEGLEEFRERINTYIKNNTKPSDLIPVLEIDMQIGFSHITMDLIDEIERLEPLGEENPKALFVTTGVAKKSAPKRINNTYSLWLSEGALTFEGMISDKDMMEFAVYADRFDIVYSLEKNTYHQSPRLIIRDLRLAGSEN
ncbi:MAG: single-stranded-DNA-specific exonuclease RecJ [Candidatus Omnitrophota bacterium]